MQEFSLCADDAVAVVQTYIAHVCMKAFEFHVGIGNVSLRCCDNLFLATYTLLKSHQAVKKHNIPMSQRQHRKLTPDCGKSHQGRRNTMAQPVSSAVGAFEFCFKKNRKAAAASRTVMFLKGTSQYNKVLGNKSHGQGYVILEPYIAPPSQTLFGTAMYSLKFLAMQVRYKSCSMSFGKAKIWGYGGPLFVAAKSMGGATCIEAVDSSQEVWSPIRPAGTNWNKTFHSSQPESTLPLSAGVSRPYLPPAPNTATETLILFFFSRERPSEGFF